MKDFLKILFVLIGLVIAFVSGRNYGEQTVVESKEYKEDKSHKAECTQAEEELKITKEKFQNLLDSADLKKADEIYGKIMTIFLVDLSLRISEAKQKELDEGKAKLSMCVDPQANRAVEKVIEKPKTQHEEAKAKEPQFSRISAGRFKSTEWTLQNSTSNEEILKNLEKVKITSVDRFLVDSPETKFSDLQKYYGTFRGRMVAIDGSNYGSLVITVGPHSEKRSSVSGEVKLYREGKVESTQQFNGETWGNTPSGYQGNMVKIGQRFLQIYKIENADKIAGNFYERAPNGTTTLIGSFILNRTDKF